MRSSREPATSSSYRADPFAPLAGHRESHLPADSAGLSAGDVITRIDGRTISSPTTVRNLLLTKKPGTNVSVTYVDQFGTSQMTTVTLGSGPPR